MTTQNITIDGVTYVVEPYVDEGKMFAIIHSVAGLAKFGMDELPGLLDEDVHAQLADILEGAS